MSNKNKKPWEISGIKPGTLVKIDLNKPHITREVVMFYCETKKNLLCFSKETEHDVMFGIFLGNVDHTRPDAKILIDEDIYYIHPKYLVVIDCEKEKKDKTGSFS